MTDTAMIDMAPFLARHDRRTRWTYVAMLSLSLALSAAVLVPAMVATGAPGAVIAALWMPFVQAPVTIAALWIATALYDRKRPAFPDGRLPMNPDDARNVTRVANAGAVFVTGFGVVMIAGQVLWMLWRLGVLPHVEHWGFRVTLAAIGALCIHFGNVSPRLPTPRAPELKPGVRMKYNRLAGWMTVVLGLSLVVAGLFLPLAGLAPAVGGLSFAVLLAFGFGAIMYRAELKSPRTR